MYPILYIKNLIWNLIIQISDVEINKNFSLEIKEKIEEVLGERQYTLQKQLA